ncbi:MAG: MFS transporter [Chloroflexi bacterium]|nr:MFS transporter [Chloroflexota bacterium]
MLQYQELRNNRSRRPGITPLSKSKTSGSKIFYGWFVVAACFAITMTLGEAFWAFGVFFKPIENEFGWNRTDVSSSYTMFLIGYAVSVIITGRLSDRYSPRLVVFATAILAGLGISLASQVSTIDQLRAFLFIGGLGAGGTWSVPTSVVQRWFYGRQRAGLALSIVVCGVGVGGLIFAPFINYLILAHGWRNAYLIIGILYFVVLSISALVIRQAPAISTAPSSQEQIVPKPDGFRGWTARQAVVTPSFIGLVFAIVAAVIAFQSLTVHLAPYATDAGIPSTVSAAALGLMGGFSIPGRIICGIIADRIGWQKTLGLALLGMAVTPGLLLLPGSPALLYTFVFFYGLFHGIRAPAQIGLIGRFFGMRSLGELIGIAACIAQIIGAFAPYLAGYIFDTTGSYAMAFVLLMGVLLAGGIAAIMTKEPRGYEEPAKFNT